MNNGWNDYLYQIHRILNYEKRPYIDKAWKEIEVSDISLIQAPTGYGKTIVSQAFSYYSMLEGFKSILTYPLRTLLEDQLMKFNDLFVKMGYRDVVGARYMHHLDSKYFVKPITLTTIDTLSMTLFGLEPLDLDKVLKKYMGFGAQYSLGHYLFSRATTVLSNIVLDEAHLLADTTKSLNYLIALLKISKQSGNRVLMLTATLPKALEDTLKNYIDGIRIARFHDSDDQVFTGERKRKVIEKELQKLGGDKYQYIVEWIINKTKELDGYRRILIVFNTINEALEMYSKIRDLEEFRGFEKILIHSRFKEKDREEKIERLKKARDRDFIVIATQVIEAGVDISSNIFVTDIAPANSLIQRLGRFLRYVGEDHGHMLIWSEDLDKEEHGGRYKVYDIDLVRKTYDYLQNHLEEFNPHLPSSYQDLLDNTYGMEDYGVDANLVDDLVTLLLSLKSPRRSVEKFIELEGSFVREGVMVPVISVNDYKQYAGNLVELRKHVLPLNADLLRKLYENELLKAKLVFDESTGQINEINIDKRDLLSKIKIISTSFSSNFIAYLINTPYNDEEGLLLKLSEGE